MFSNSACLLNAFLSTQGPPGEHGERGEPGDEGYQVDFPIKSLLDVSHSLSFCCGFTEMCCESESDKIRSHRRKWLTQFHVL